MTIQEGTKIISARRSYEFGPDQLRLSMLTIEGVRESVKDLFHFEQVTLGSPPQTFGRVPATIPPGLVYNYGAVVVDEEVLIPIRFLHFEANRIVIDVGGPSSALDVIFQQLQALLSGLKAPDGSPIIGEPVAILDRSELHVSLPFPSQVFLVSSISEVLSRFLLDDTNQVLMSSLRARAALPDTVFHREAHNEWKAFTLEVRSGTTPNEHTYYSAAPLQTSEHLRMIRELQAALA